MLERSGSTLAPAGMIWSVVILSPTFSKISPESAAVKPGWSGSGLMFGPRTISTDAGVSGGATIMASARSGSPVNRRICGKSPSVRGSVSSPVSAAAAATSGLVRKTLADFVPERPSKFRLKVRTDTALVERRLAHADARSAAGLQHARAGGDEVGEHAAFRDHLDKLASIPG